jgi:D-hydroxyproline dehydrogenase subunit alpha
VAETLAADIAVVGAGPAGLAAAVRAAEEGARVAILDEGPRPGGQIWKHSSLPPRGARRWIERAKRCGVLLRTGWQVVFAEPGRLFAEASAGPSEERLDVRCRAIVLAVGARELFLPFPGWTLPGVVGAGAAQALVKSGLDVRGRRAVVAGSGPLLLAAAGALSSAGARVLVVAEQAPSRRVWAFALGLAKDPARLAAAASLRMKFPAARYRTGTWIASAQGDERLEAVVVTDGRRSREVPCDLLCCGFGLVPNLELPAMLGCDVARGRVVVDDFQRSSVSSVLCAGEATGVGGVELALVEGEIAGLAASGRAERARRLFRRRARLTAFAASLGRAFALRTELKTTARADTIVCRCEDVVLSRLAPSWSRRQAKLYTRAGMGPCQGRVCGPALEFLFGWGADSVRVPLRPASLASLVAIPDLEKEGAATT